MKNIEDALVRYEEVISLTDGNVQLVYNARKELATLKQHLKEIEFVYIGPDDYDQCPVCHVEEGHEHKPDCWLHNAIKE